MNEYDKTKDEGGKPRARTEAGAGAGRAGALELEASREIEKTVIPIIYQIRSVWPHDLAGLCH